MSQNEIFRKRQLFDVTAIVLVHTAGLRRTSIAIAFFDKNIKLVSFEAQLSVISMAEISACARSVHFVHKCLNAKFFVFDC